MVQFANFVKAKRLDALPLDISLGRTVDSIDHFELLDQCGQTAGLGTFSTIDGKFNRLPDKVQFSV